jgi:hypothetical protein
MDEKDDKKSTASSTTQNTELVKRRNFWKREEEALLQEWADKAHCYQWLHYRSHEIFKWKNSMFTIPVIIISTVTGTANFAQDRFGDGYKNLVVMIIGAFNILAGIITTIFQFLKISELNEAHRVASMAWGKFYRNVKTELTRHPLDRTLPSEMLKYSRGEYDRLVETSPFIPRKVVDMFNYKFKKNIDFIKPEICDKIHGTQVFNISDRERNELRLMLEGGSPASAQNEMIYLEDPPQERTLADIEAEFERNNRELREKHSELISEIEDYVTTYLKMNGRKPTQEEIKQMAKTLNGGRNSPGNDSLDTDGLVDEIFGEKQGRHSPVAAALAYASSVNLLGRRHQPLQQKPAQMSSLLKPRAIEPDIDTSTVGSSDV